MNFLYAVIVGVGIGLIGGFALRGRQPNVIWLSPVLATAGALIGALLGAVFGDTRQYGPKEITLQVLLAIVGVGVTYFLGSRAPAGTPGGPAG